MQAKTGLMTKLDINKAKNRCKLSSTTMMWSTLYVRQ